MQEYSNSAIDALIKEHIHSDRDAEILRMRLIHGFTYEHIGETVNPQLSAGQVFRIVKRESANLFKYLQRQE